MVNSLDQLGIPFSGLKLEFDSTAACRLKRAQWVARFAGFRNDNCSGLVSTKGVKVEFDLLAVHRWSQA